MKKVVSGARIKELDRAAVAAGIPAEALMENAGSGVARIVARYAPGKRVVAICGKGGNGGDALVAARILVRAGFRVRAFTTAPIEDMIDPTRTNARALSALDPRAVRPLADDLTPLMRAAAAADVVIDGLFGIGVDRPVTGRYAAVIEAINRAPGLRVAVDLPSGLPSDSGIPIGPAVRAELTACMAAYKPAHLLYPAREYCGRIELIPVGYPEMLWKGVVPIAQVTDESWVRDHLPGRPPAGHKGTFGRVLIVAGSLGMSGAAIMSALGALRAGAGLVTVACPRSILPIVGTAVPEVLTIPLPDSDGHLSPSALQPLVEASSRVDVVAIGPGLGRAPETGTLVRSLLEEIEAPLVLDADGLYPLTARLDALAPVAGRAVLTPHPGEMARLVGRRAEEVDTERIKIARSFAKDHGVTLLLKGRPTAIGTPEGEVFLNPTGNTGLATGGSGDVLTGLIAGLIAGGVSPADAAVVGAYVHGRAAELLSRDRAERSVIPRDLIQSLPYAFKELEDA